MSVEEIAVDKHSRNAKGQFIILLPCRPDAKAVGESRSQAVHNFMILERSLCAKNCFTTSFKSMSLRAMQMPGLNLEVCSRWEKIGIFDRRLGKPGQE